MAFSIFVIISALIMVSLPFSDKYAQGILTNNLASTAKNLIALVAAFPSAVFDYAASNTSATLIFLLCLYLHIELDGNEAKFLQEAQVPYSDMHEIWVYGIITPIGAIVGAVYASLVPLFNFVVYVPSAAFFGTLEVLCECGDPSVLVSAIANLVKSAGQLIYSIGDAFTGDKSAWLSNSISIDSVVEQVQTGTIEPIVGQMDCLCTLLAPTIELLSGWATSPMLAGAIHSFINTFWRSWQVPAQLAALNTFNVTPVFDEMRDFCFYTGGLLDLGAETTLNWMQLQTHLGGKIVLPKPSLGTGLMRQLAATI